MAQTKSTSLVQGFTRASGAGFPGATVYGPTKPTGLVLQDHEGYDYYLWFSTSGVLRTTDATTAEAAGFDWDSGGSAVGGQS